jgi:threonine dehydrogenase-like Zn-dependent dehydrogenase
MYGQKYIPLLVEHVLKGEVELSAVFSHHLPLAEAPQGFKLFKHKKDNCLRRQKY